MTEVTFELNFDGPGNFPIKKKKTISVIGEKDFPKPRSTLDYTGTLYVILAQLTVKL